MSNIIVCDIWFLLYEHKEGRNKRMILWFLRSSHAMIFNFNLTLTLRRGTGSVNVVRTNSRDLV